ncbi:MAG: hypothetical protein V3V98_09930 [Thermoplasmata archaeon]
MASVFILNPLKDLDDLRKKKEYFTAIVFANTYIEYFGFKKILSTLQERGIQVPEEKLKNLRLSEIILLLYTLGIVDLNTYGELHRLRRARNRLVHEVSKRYVLTDQNAVQLIRSAKECIRKLMR